MVLIAAHYRILCLVTLGCRMSPVVGLKKGSLSFLQMQVRYSHLEKIFLGGLAMEIAGDKIATKHNRVSCNLCGRKVPCGEGCCRC